jgi:hypothetical protein
MKKPWISAEKRAVLMADWATYLAKPEADVVTLRAA